MDNFELEEAQPLLPQNLPKASRGVFRGVAGALALVGVAGAALRRSATAATDTHLKAGSNGVQKPALLLVVKSGSYSDEPGAGYAAINPKRFAEPHRATTFNVTAPFQAITDCTWSTANAKPGEAGGPWDDIVGVEAAETFARNGKTTSSAEVGNLGHAFEVTYPSPGTWAVSITCNLADGSKATIVNEVTITAR
jgi:hypothetical protein